MKTPEFTTLHYSLEEVIATLTLNRPYKFNAFNGAMQHELIAAFDHTDADDAVRAVIVTGAAVNVGKTSNTPIKQHSKAPSNSAYLLF